ncbi:MAG: site-2 protease family protein, partial [Deltaproteobacteria bacterium]
MSIDITQWIVRIPVLLFSITLHEYAHGRTALWLGDPTAERMGRLSLNPLPHIDPFGAVCLFLFNFGWAKPVPVNPAYFKNIRKGIILMSLAGPFSNLLAALLAGVLIRFILLPWQIYQTVLVYMVLMNIGLGIFNLIPIPPLDGSHVLENLLPLRAGRGFRGFKRYGPMALIGIILLDNFAHT